MTSIKVGVLAIQGDVAEHMRALEECGAEPAEVRSIEELRDLDGLIIPGGESTTIGMLAEEYGLIEALQKKIASGFPVWGTCAGLILLADELKDRKIVRGRPQPLIGGLKVVVERNAFGRQVDSFEADLQVEGLDHGPYRAVFIRAPIVRSCGEGVEILAQLADDQIVAIRQGDLLGTSFHPELTSDRRFHEYFVGMIRGRGD